MQTGKWQLENNIWTRKHITYGKGINTHISYLERIQTDLSDNNSDQTRDWLSGDFIFVPIHRNLQSKQQLQNQREMEQLKIK